MHDPRTPQKDSTVKNDFLFKVCMFLNSLLQKPHRYWESGKNLIIVEQNLWFQGKHPKKLHTAYKKVGNGFQCGVVFDDRYIFSFFT